MRNFSFSQSQNGVALFIALIALVILSIAAIALIRSTDTAQLISGNLAIKRDMTHESELATEVAVNAFSGALNLEASRWADIPASNYYSFAQPTTLGIPTALLQASSTGETSAGAASGMTYRYLIDRMCPLAGAPNLQHCTTGVTVAGAGGDSTNPKASGGGGTPSSDNTTVYRITVRVTDARHMQSYFQTTLSSFGH